jgi:hypothetical protein
MVNGEWFTIRERRVLSQILALLGVVGISDFPVMDTTKTFIR